MAVFGIDVSHYQGTIDWGKVAASGVQFAIIKATEGTGYADPSFVANVTGARSHGIIPGAYHFLHGGNVSGQWNFFTRVVGKPDGMLIVCDEEASDVSPSDVAAWDSARKAWNGPHGYYSNRGLWRGGAVAAADTWPWHAGNANGRYTSATGSLQSQFANTTLSPSAFGGFNSFKMIQFTDHAIVPGIGTPVDGNVWLGTLADLQALIEGADMPFTDADAKTWGQHRETFGSNIGNQSYDEMLGGTYAHARDVADAIPAIQQQLAALQKAQTTPTPVTVDTAAIVAALQPVLAGLVRQAVVDVLHTTTPAAGQ